MGNCNCKHPRTEPCVSVEDIPKPVHKRTQEENTKLIRVKSMRYQGNNIDKTSDIMEDKLNFQSGPQSSKNVNTELNSKKNTESIILEYDINEDEQKRLKEALYKHFLFNDMNDEIL
jgi:hypothetical protein